MREDYLQKRGLLELSISYGMDNLCLLEVGSFAGESMEIFNSTGLFKTIICVDTWSDLKSEHEFNSYSKMILVEHQFDQKKKQIRKRVQVSGNFAGLHEKRFVRLLCRRDRLHLHRRDAYIRGSEERHKDGN